MKTIWKSKTFWVNILGLVVLAVGQDIIPAQAQVAILGTINIILRLVTKEEIVWE